MLSAADLSLQAWITVVAAAGLAGADGTSWPQAMVSRPLVAGCAGGWLLGDAAAGLAAGAVLELLFLRHLPLGGARCPDAGPAGVVAGAAAVAGGPPGVAVTAAAAAAGWAVGWIGEATVRLQRRLAGRLVGDAEALSAAARSVERRHRALIAVDALRAALVAAVFLVPAVMAVRLVAGAGRGPAAAVLLLAGGAALAAGAGAARLPAGGRGRAALLVAAGAVAGLVAVGVVG